MKPSFFPLSFPFGLLLLCQVMSLRAGTNTLTFESLTGMGNFPGSVVPVTSRLSDQLIGSHGVSFRSGADAAYVALVTAIALPSGTNGIGGVNGAMQLDYSAPLDIRFFTPSNPSHPAETDFFSIKGDVLPLGGGTVTLEAFDASGGTIASLTQVDDHPIVFVLAQPKIHRIRLTQTSGTVAFDDLSFATPVPIEQPLLTIDVSQVRLCWYTLTNKVYQLQYRSALTTNAWVNLGDPMPGSGSTSCTTEPVTDPRRFYRVTVLP